MQIVSHYGEPIRHYHTINHVKELLNLVDQYFVIGVLHDSNALRLAVWFHEYAHCLLMLLFFFPIHLNLVLHSIHIATVLFMILKGMTMKVKAQNFSCSLLKKLELIIL